MKRHLLGIVLAMLLPGYAAQAVHAADDVILRLQFAPLSFAAGEGRIVWSEAETRNEETRYRLQTWRRGVTSRLPITLDVPANDIDLGRNAQGHQVLTYSLCDGWCKMYEYDFTSRRKHRLPVGIDQSWWNLAPTRWGRHLVWRRESTYSSAISPQILIKRLPNGRVRKLLGGAGAAHDVDLRRGRVAYVWGTATPRGQRWATRLVNRRGEVRAVSSWRTQAETVQELPYFSPEFTAAGLLVGFRRFEGSDVRNALEYYAGGRLRREPAPDAVLGLGPFGKRIAYLVAENYWEDKFTQGACPCEVRLR